MGYDVGVYVVNGIRILAPKTGENPRREFLDFSIVDMVADRLGIVTGEPSQGEEEESEERSNFLDEITSGIPIPGTTYMIKQYDSDEPSIYIVLSEQRLRILRTRSENPLPIIPVPDQEMDEFITFLRDSGVGDIIPLSYSSDLVIEESS